MATAKPPGAGLPGGRGACGIGTARRLLRAVVATMTIAVPFQGRLQCKHKTLAAVIVSAVVFAIGGWSVGSKSGTVSKRMTSSRMTRRIARARDARSTSTSTRATRPTRLRLVRGLFRQGGSESTSTRTARPIDFRGQDAAHSTSNQTDGIQFPTAERRRQVSSPARLRVAMFRCENKIPRRDSNASTAYKYRIHIEERWPRGRPLGRQLLTTKRPPERAFLLRWHAACS